MWLLEIGRLAARDVCLIPAADDGSRFVPNAGLLADVQHE